MEDALEKKEDDGFLTTNYADNPLNVNDVDKQEQKQSNTINDLVQDKKYEDNNIEEQMNKITKTSINKINEQIKKENKALEENTEAYNFFLKKGEEINNRFGKKILQTVANDRRKILEQFSLEADQHRLIAEQNIARAEDESTRAQLGFGQTKMSEMQKKAEESNVEDPDEDPNGNPLVSISYLQRLYENMQYLYQKNQETQQDILDNKNNDLQKNVNIFQDKQRAKALQEMNRKRMLTQYLQRNTSKKKQINTDIDNNYDALNTINSKFKKILGLKKKYSKKIEEIEEPSERQIFVKKFNNDVNKILKSDKSDLMEETRKFDKNGNRVETPMEKKERKKEDKLKKKYSQSNRADAKQYQKRIADNINNDKLQNINNTDLQKNTISDKKIKDAYRNNNMDKNNDNLIKNYNNLIENNDNKTNLLKINNINNADSIQNNINLPKMQNKQNKNIFL